jgi:hypothetical protein
MTEQLFDSRQGNPLLRRIYEGMTVYDRTDNKIGTVEYVYPGELPEVADQRGQKPATLSVRGSHARSLIEAFGREIALTDYVPDTLREELLRHGFLRINCAGLFVADRYAKPEQIASVSNDGVTLRVTRDELIKH